MNIARPKEQQNLPEVTGDKTILGISNESISAA